MVVPFAFLGFVFDFFEILFRAVWRCHWWSQGAGTGQKLGEKIPCAVSRDRPKRPAPVRVMAKKLSKVTTIKVTTIQCERRKLRESCSNLGSTFSRRLLQTPPHPTRRIVYSASCSRNHRGYFGGGRDYLGMFRASHWECFGVIWGCSGIILGRNRAENRRSKIKNNYLKIAPDSLFIE